MVKVNTKFKFVSLLIILFSLLNMGIAADNYVIDHTNWNPANLDQPSLDAVRTKKLYFGHASIGSQIIEGLKNMSNNNSPKYGMSFYEDPAVLNGPALVYPYIGPNGNPFDKIKRFDDRMHQTDSNGNRWGDILDIAYFKFCYVDVRENADVDSTYNSYIREINSLKAEFPSCVFVYFTVPLDGRVVLESSRLGNRNRAMVNDKIRAYVKANGGYLFDIADLEAHDENGVLQTFELDGQTYPKAWFVEDNYENDGWMTSDGGEAAHLNDRGKEHLANAMWQLWANIVTPTVTGLPASDNNPVSESFVISDNYPNPFNPTTQFNVKLSTPGSLTLEVFNILGNKVDEVNYTNLSQGANTITWSANNFSSGVYFYRFRSKTQDNSSKIVRYGRMILMK